jgi:hypothetical protein
MVVHHAAHHGSKLIIAGITASAMLITKVVTGTVAAAHAVGTTSAVAGTAGVTAVKASVVLAHAASAAVAHGTPLASVAHAPTVAAAATVLTSKAHGLSLALQAAAKADFKLLKIIMAEFNLLKCFLNFDWKGATFEEMKKFLIACFKVKNICG